MLYTSKKNEGEMMNKQQTTRAPTVCLLYIPRRGAAKTFLHRPDMAAARAAWCMFSVSSFALAPCIRKSGGPDQCRQGGLHGCSGGTALMMMTDWGAPSELQWRRLDRHSVRLIINSRFSPPACSQQLSCSCKALVPTPVARSAPRSPDNDDSPPTHPQK